ncbi:histidinol-phosphate aminotransferase family protein [Arcobacter arenosus]|uniref:Histidinol-phosphate aminotransferase family protein n=1 Tax=Arcobacter arenosus TaxID=2576037 RepID=A0A5R8Y149_9BACT|nr:histidinol-phosphate aminotransferase family protein [Arcobacter arenosus]TLP38487.1 histidinol-phosphate aminotransferase family protein [Arcobacter arenosus]
MIDFSCDLNFLKPNTNIDYSLISSADYSNLLNLLEKRYHISKNQIELYNGFSSAIYSLLKFLDLKYCFIYSPCSLAFKKAATNLSYEVRLINRFENLFLPIKQDSLVVFANPSYLDGTYYDLENLFKYWKEKNATVLIDETMLDFCGEDAAIKYLEEYEKLYIIKNLSIYYSNENLNISTLFSIRRNIESIRKYEPENKLSAYDMKYLEESLKDWDFKVISNSVNIKNRIELEKIFHSCKYVDFLFHSSSNSLLIKLKKINSKEFRLKLQEKNIIVPNCLKYDFIDESFVNIYVDSKQSIARLKEILYAI